MALNSDELGFLKGDAVHWSDAIKLWSDIRDDMHALRESMSGVAAQAKRTATNSGGRTSAVNASPRLRNEQGRFIAAIQAVSAPSQRSQPGGEAAPIPKDVAPVQPRRNSHGYVAKISAGAHSVANAISNAPDINPTIAASKELGAIVAPVGRGLSKLFGKKDDEKSTPSWLKRIWTTMNRNAISESAYHRAELRQLGAIANKPADEKVGGGSGILGSVFGLLKNIPGAGLLGRGIAGLGSMGGLAGLAKGAMKLGGGFMRKIPLLGGLFAGGSAIASMVGPDDPDKSLEENRKDRFTGAGSGIGAIAGGALGTLLDPFIGPLGTMIGGMLGDKVGEMIGSWLSTVDWGKIGNEISDAWNGSLKFFTGAWKSVTDTMTPIVSGAKAIIDGISGWLKNRGIAVLDAAKDLGTKANDAVKGATGIDLKAGVKATVSVVGDTAKSAAAATKVGIDAAADGVKTVASATKTGADAAVDYTKTRVEKMTDPIARAAVGLKKWALGQTSKQYESGTGGAGTVSNGKGDAGGASYGTYQLSSKRGVAADFVSKSTHAADFAGLVPGSKAFNDKWKEVAVADPDFGNQQHDYIKNTHYDPLMAKLKQGGMDLSGRGAAVQDSVWSTAVQFGGSSSLIQNALQGKDIRTMSDTEIVSAIQDYKIANNDSLFKSSSSNTRASTLAREKSEKQRLVSLAMAGYAASAVPTLASSGAPTAPAVSAVPSISASTGVSAMSSIPEIPSSSGPIQVAYAKPQIVQVDSNKRDVGQDISDRKIAHIATGGIGGATGNG